MVNLIYGHDGFAGELDHTIVIPNGRLHRRNRQTWFIESYASATGVRLTAIEMLSKNDEPSLLRDVPVEKLNSKKVFEAAIAGDKLAKEIFEFTGQILGLALANSVMFSSPEAIILFGV